MNACVIRIETYSQFLILYVFIFILTTQSKSNYHSIVTFKWTWYFISDYSEIIPQRFVKKIVFFCITKKTNRDMINLTRCMIDKLILLHVEKECPGSLELHFSSATLLAWRSWVWFPPDTLVCDTTVEVTQLVYN